MSAPGAVSWTEVYPPARFMGLAVVVMVAFVLSINVSGWILVLMAVLTTVAVRDLSRVAEHEDLGGPVVRVLRGHRRHRWARALLLVVLLAVAVVGAILGLRWTFAAGLVIWIVLTVSCVPIFQYALGRARGRIEAPTAPGRPRRG